MDQIEDIRGSIHGEQIGDRLFFRPDDGSYHLLRDDGEAGYLTTLVRPASSGFSQWQAGPEWSAVSEQEWLDAAGDLVEVSDGTDPVSALARAEGARRVHRR